MSNDTDRTHRIRELNDALRQRFDGGQILMTPGVSELPAELQGALLDAVRTFADFSVDNDPRGEHDFGSIDLGDRTWFSQESAVGTNAGAT